MLEAVGAGPGVQLFDVACGPDDVASAAAARPLALRERDHSRGEVHAQNARVWEPPPQTVPFAIVLEAVEQHGVPVIGVPPGPPMFRFADSHEARRVLEGIGFESVSFQTLPITLALADPDALFQIMLDAGVRTSGLLKAQTPAALDRIREHMAKRVAEYRANNGADEAYVLPMPAVLITASKPVP